MAEPITFYLEFSSPFAYLAAQLIEPVGERHDREVLWRPISIAHVWQAIGYRADMVPRIKMRHTRLDAARCAKLADVPFTEPTPFPVDARLARRTFYRLDADNPALAKRFALAVFDQYWGEGRDIREPVDLAGLAAGLRIDPAELEAARADDAAKQRMVAASDAALASGCYGVPWFVVDAETFWGHDRIPYIDRWLDRQAA